MIVSAVFGSVLFACLASAATIAAGLVTQNVTPFDDGPPPGRPPSAILIVAATARQAKRNAPSAAETIIARAP